MLNDIGEYDISQFAFDEETQDLVDRTHQRLAVLFVHLNVSSDDLYYVAASAVECLRDRRADYLYGLADCSPAAECELRAQVGRVDAHFYFKLARLWAAERSSAQTNRPLQWRLLEGLSQRNRPESRPG